MSIWVFFILGCVIWGFCRYRWSTYMGRLTHKHEFLLKNRLLDHEPVIELGEEYNEEYLFNVFGAFCAGMMTTITVDLMIPPMGKAYVSFFGGCLVFMIWTLAVWLVDFRRIFSSFIWVYLVIQLMITVAINRLGPDPWKIGILAILIVWIIYGFARDYLNMRGLPLIIFQKENDSYKVIFADDLNRLEPLQKNFFKK